MLIPGTTVDRYAVEAVLGHGGMAVVYRVRHVELGHARALKVLSMDAPRVQERLLQEGRIQSGLSHPNLVAVHDVLRVGERPGLVLDLVEGPSLADRMAQGSLSLDEAEQLFRGIAAGVAHAHAAGVVHRDLKPSNVLLAETEAGWLPKVTDFGVAKVLEMPEGGTATGLALGTPRYMAPEQIRDASRVDARSDVWALGCLLYELVVGEPPLLGRDPIALYRAAVERRWTPAAERVPGMPQRIARAIDASLQADPGRRAPDVQTLLAVLSGEPWTPLEAAETLDGEWSGPEGAGLQAGVVLGEQVRLVERLGATDGAQTWRAVWVEDESAVVVRALPGAVQPELRERLTRESRVLRELDHPCVPRFRDAFTVAPEQGGWTVLVRDWVGGRTLSDVLSDRRFALPQVLDLLADLLDTLVYLHRLSPPVVHRDLHPGNLIRAADGRLLLVDFGSVRDTLGDSVLGGHSFVGTFGYMAPEQYGGDASPASDCYSVGALAVWLLTRREPRELLDGGGQIAWHARVDVADDVRQWVDALLAPEPGDRPSSKQARDQLHALRLAAEAPEPESAGVVGLEDAGPHPGFDAPESRRVGYAEPVDDPVGGPRDFAQPPAAYTGPEALDRPQVIPSVARRVLPWALGSVAVFGAVWLGLGAIAYLSLQAPSAPAAPVRTAEAATAPLPQARGALESMFDRFMLDRGAQGCLSSARARGIPGGGWLDVNVPLTLEGIGEVSVGSADLGDASVGGCVTEAAARYDWPEVDVHTPTILVTRVWVGEEWATSSSDLQPPVNERYLGVYEQALRDDEAIASCARMAMVEHPELAKVPWTFRFEVTEFGPADAGFSDPALQGSTVETCIVEAVSTSLIYNYLLPAEPIDVQVTLDPFVLVMPGDGP